MRSTTSILLLLELEKMCLGGLREKNKIPRTRLFWRNTRTEMKKIRCTRAEWKCMMGTLIFRRGKKHVASGLLRARHVRIEADGACLEGSHRAVGARREETKHAKAIRPRPDSRDLTPYASAGSVHCASSCLPPRGRGRVSWPPH